MKMNPSTIVSLASTTIELSIGRTPRSAFVECSVGSIKIAAAYVSDVSVKCRLPSLKAGSYEVALSIDGERSASTQLVVFDLLPVKVKPSRGPIEGSSTLLIETNLRDVLCVFKDVGSSKAVATDKGLQCPTPEQISLRRRNSH